MNRIFESEKRNARRRWNAAVVVAVGALWCAPLALAAAADDSARRVSQGMVTAAPLAAQDQARLQQAEAQLTQLRGKIAGLRKKVATERVNVERSKGVKLPPVMYRSPAQTSSPSSGTPSGQTRTLVPKKTVPLTAPPSTTGTTPAPKSTVPLIFKPTLTAPQKEKEKEKTDKGKTQTIP